MLLLRVFVATMLLFVASQVDQSYADNPFELSGIIRISAYEPGKEVVTVQYRSKDITNELLQRTTRKLLAGCGSPADLQQIRRNNGKSTITFKSDLDSLARKLNGECGFSHSCAQGAEILYSESGRPFQCHFARAAQAWDKSPGHKAIIIGNYGNVGCNSIFQSNENKRIRRCCFN